MKAKYIQTYTKGNTGLCSLTEEKELAEPTIALRPEAFSSRELALSGNKSQGGGVSCHPEKREVSQGWSG